jgi:SNF2 family DNA or RNA helicase
MKNPFPHQQAAIELGVRTNLLLADKCGLGKTVSAIEIVKHYLTRSDDDSNIRTGQILIVCPKRVREQWVEELAQQDTRPTRILESPNAPYVGYCVTHFEALSKLTKNPAFRKVLWDVMIVDEAHYICNRSAQRTTLIKSIRAIRKIAMTGTPMEKDPSQLWSICNWLYPDTFKSYWAFRNHFVLTETSPWGNYEKVVGAKNVDQLANLLRPFTLRRTKEEVAPQLPPKIIGRVPVRMDAEQERVYKKVKNAKDLVVNLEDGSTNPLIVQSALTQILALQRIASLPEAHFSLKIGSAKFEWLKGYLEDNPDETVVIFTRFVDTAKYIADHISMSERDLYIGGSDRPLAFLNGQKRLLVGTIAMMGEGQNYQRAKTAIFFEQDWSTIKMSQAYDRIHRIDITESKNIILLESKNTVDGLILDAIDHKWSETEMVYLAIKRGLL